MSKYGVAVSIDVKAIDKARLVNHTNGKTYLNMTVFIDPGNPDQYGQHGMITQDVSKEERDQGVKGNILGNAKVFWNEQQGAPTPRQQAPQQQPPQQGYTPAPNQAPQGGGSFDDNQDIPFANPYKGIEHIV